jgi:cytochrome c-type biogenesis protein CcmF
MMFSQLGFLCLASALAFLLTGLFRRQSSDLMFLTRLACGLIVSAFLLLSICFLRNDFSVLYVLKNSSTLLPWYYQFCAVWGGHEGSVLLWVTLLSVWTFALSFQCRRMDSDFSQKLMLVLMIVLLGLLSFILLTSNPFQLQFIDLDTQGKDLNPLLQDPGFLLHPPLLYVGYVGFAVPFAFAMAALWSGKFEKQYMQFLKPWVFLAWSCLTLGICLGSWWAYRELGWGGFWFWDPVENASFMPWLVGTALLHALIVSEKQETFVAWTILLAVTAFALSLIGTFLVRSGVLTSVHAFAVDPKRGLFILLFLVAMMSWAFGLYIVKAHHLFINKPMYWFSRESSILMNNILLFIMMLVVLLGTLYPLIIDGLGLGKLSVGAPYFNTVMVPMLMVFLLMMGLAIHLRWQKDNIAAVLKKLSIPFIAAILSAGFTIFCFEHTWNTKVWLILSLAFWVILSLVFSLYQRYQMQGGIPKQLSYWAMWIAHLGFACTVIGITVSTGYGIEKDLKMAPSEQVQIAGHQVRFIQEKQIKGSNYHGSMVQFKIDKNAYAYPEKRIYNIGQMVMTDASVDATLWRDIYLALGEPIGQQAWAVRVYYKPMIRWIWLGGLLMAIGGFVALYSHRRDWWWSCD